MNTTIVDVTGIPQVHEMLSQFTNPQLTNRLRRALRAGLKPLRVEMRRKAGEGGFPRRFKSTRTRAHRNPLGVSVSPQSPLSTIFEHGARPHMIGAISHPGMAARPFIAPVFAAAEDEAYKEVIRVLMEGI